MWIDQAIDRDTFIDLEETYSSDYDVHLGMEVGDSVESGFIHDTSQNGIRIDEIPEIEELPDSPVSVEKFRDSRGV